MRKSAQNQLSAAAVFAFPHTVGFDELAAWSGLKRPSAVAKWLFKQGIEYRLNAKNQPVTTVKHLNDFVERGKTTRPTFKFGKSRDL